VGNVVAGGTGKTPFVLFLAQHFSQKRVAILSRGYGAFPDEPTLLSRRIPGLSIYVGADRVKLAKQAVADGADLLILDDGFQHRRLHRDFDLVLLDGEDPFGKGHYLPRGFLRDSPKRLAQADAVLAQGVHFKMIPQRILGFQGEEIPSVLGWKVGVFCGIAKPARFKKTVSGLGCEIVSEWILADHQAPEMKKLKRFVSECRALGAKALLCTEKDQVKLSPTDGFELPILFLEMGLQPIQNDGFWEKFIVKIDQKIDNSSTL
jgi:tetraacyldisaccharide 4'-kinase